MSLTRRPKFRPSYLTMTRTRQGGGGRRRVAATQAEQETNLKKPSRTASNGRKTCRTCEIEHGETRTAGCVHAGKVVRVQNGQPVVVIEEDVEEYGIYE